ncbi:hypothetical protein BDD12DRAFT_942329 [Trichophaea hybrida]|nr:hypothetical protein BDD12DRAFT_942329 [Trichophaea hybrida]
MEMRMKILSKEHPHTITSMNNLVVTFWNQGRLNDVENLFLQVIETRSMVLGHAHPNTLNSMNNLALTYMNQGWLVEAEELQVQAINSLRTTLGEDHPSTVAAIGNLTPIHEKSVEPRHFSVPNELMEGLRDELQQMTTLG